MVAIGCAAQSRGASSWPALAPTEKLVTNDGNHSDPQPCTLRVMSLTARSAAERPAGDGIPITAARCTCEKPLRAFNADLAHARTASGAFRLRRVE